jgi:hypothetical protein
MHRAILGFAGLLLLLLCLPWGSLALYGVLGAFPYETGGVCNAGRPLWAIGQLVVAVAGIVFTGKVSIAAMATAAQERHDAGRRWLFLGYALLTIAAWLLLVLVLVPEGTPVAAAECA